MSKFTEYIGSQFGNPRGLIGRICCIIMNVINKAMYKKTVALIDAGPDDKVLDIGYGNGYLLKYLYKKTRSDLYGILSRRRKKKMWTGLQRYRSSL